MYSKPFVLEVLRPVLNAIEHVVVNIAMVGVSILLNIYLLKAVESIGFGCFCHKARG